MSTWKDIRTQDELFSDMLATKWRQDSVDRVSAFLSEMLPEYAAALGVSEEEAFITIEARRDYAAANYYQRSNFPELSTVRVFDTKEDLYGSIDKSLGFRCPKCSGASKDPYECTEDGCDWKSYGLFRTLGKGAVVATKDTLLEGGPQHIFMPISWEAQS